LSTWKPIPKAIMLETTAAFPVGTPESSLFVTQCRSVASEIKLTVVDGVKRVLRDALQLGDRGNALHESTALFGSLPEFDSMVVVAVVAGLEEQFGIEIDDDDITAEVFETVGSLTRFVHQKLAD
jgi:acyl carrier protein